MCSAVDKSSDGWSDLILERKTPLHTLRLRLLHKLSRVGVEDGAPPNLTSAATAAVLFGDGGQPAATATVANSDEGRTRAQELLKLAHVAAAPAADAPGALQVPAPPLPGSGN